MTKNAFILNFFKLYNMLWKLCLPFLARNKRLKHGFQKRITSFHHSRADIWIQAASAGEAYLAVQIIKKLTPQTPLTILATSITSQGMDILKTRLTRKTISSCINLKIEWFPFDMPQNIKKAVKKINPCIMVLLETEIWPALLYYLKQNKTKIFIINARLSQKSYTHYRKTKILWKHLEPDVILSTSRQDAQKYGQIFETKRIKTMSNIKFESIDTDILESATQKRIRNIFPQTVPLTILASIRKQEEKEVILIIKTILKAFPNQVIAVFPRHMHRIDACKRHLKSSGLKFCLRSEITDFPAKPGIILWDTFGELKTAYSCASVVFVGGSLKPLGGQNFLEPAMQGAVTVIGPHYDDFAWVTDEIFKQGIVIKKSHWKTVAETILKTLENPSSQSTCKHMAQKFIKTHQGGAGQVCDEILKAFDDFF
ncbi:3-deoxy-D-manno-octulosonic acid transferase [Desulfobacula toluolica]|uniref:3-deoxy-D-manno-octulosonic acid transferase n=1 Tax=Desulfobacula toluolica (strain DSM 7467 / Tol2) TaxID=651182 RepID=K0NF84_DESTT|nr:glycosyltransferase N-terminal domain-containing protein [Desulfobacula toluolica]CCK79776.1 WaaA2: 3-deoxy-D-manno-octulosonic-acid transferase [Desulfobacula toluolica Tol2]